jgi:HSP20 family protein
VADPAPIALLALAATGTKRFDIARLGVHPSEQGGSPSHAVKSKKGLDSTKLSRVYIDYLTAQPIGDVGRKARTSRSTERREVTMVRFMDPLAEIDRMMSPYGGRWRGGIMPMDVFEHDGVYTLRFDLPGVNADDIDLTVEDNVLKVTAERPAEDIDGVTWMLRERPAGTHRRDVRLGDRLDAGSVNASHDNGVLTVTIPMRDEAKPHKVAISSDNAEKITASASA